MAASTTSNTALDFKSHVNYSIRITVSQQSHHCIRRMEAATPQVQSVGFRHVAFSNLWVNVLYVYMKLQIINLVIQRMGIRKIIPELLTQTNPDRQSESRVDKTTKRLNEGTQNLLRKMNQRTGTRNKWTENSLVRDQKMDII